MEIRKSTPKDKSEIETVHLLAFGEKEGPEIAGLVNDLFEDETASPLLSLVAVKNRKIAGHVLFTNATIRQADETVSAQLLAPLGVLPEMQKRGIGTRLVKEGLSRLRESGVEVVFVLGHPEYYPRCGFITAGDNGIEAPYPIPEKDAAAWMVIELKEGVIGKVQGKVQCAKVLDQPQYWRE